MKANKTKRTKVTFKIGSAVEIRDGRYSSARGVVTEVIGDTVQVYGLDYRDNVGYHEIQFDDIISHKTVEKKRLYSEITQELRRMESKKILAEVKFRELERDINEALEISKALLGSATT